jgi:hypothetical protein
MIIKVKTDEADISKDLYPLFLLSHKLQVLYITVH